MNNTRKKLKCLAKMPPMERIIAKACSEKTIYTDKEMSFFVYPITMKEIESCDTSSLSSDLRPELDNPLFAAGPGHVIFILEGFYDYSPEFLKGVFRKFVLKAEEAGICWLYFTTPSEILLHSIMASSPGTILSDVCCCCHQMTIQLDVKELHQFLVGQMKNFRQFCKMVGIRRKQAVLHLEWVIEDAFPNLPPL